jgi:hypothetical protein
LRTRCSPTGQTGMRRRNTTNSRERTATSALCEMTELDLPPDEGVSPMSRLPG